MPEGPEIRHHAKRLQPMVGKQLTSVHVLSGRYVRKTIENMGRPIGETIRSITCKGKLIVIHLDKWAILTTAGMSGWWTEGSPDVKFKRIELKADDQPFTFVDMRNFGTFKVVKPEEAAEKLASLGPDILDNPEPTPEFFTRVKRFGRGQTIAEGLMDQRIVAGIGNYIRADAMFLADEDPFQPIDSISEQRLGNLWRSARAVAKEAYLLQDKYHDRVYRRDRTDEGYAVSSIVDKNGRTVWYVKERTQ